jgi:hypothetical protein
MQHKFRCETVKDLQLQEMQVLRRQVSDSVQRLYASKIWPDGCNFSKFSYFGFPSRATYSRCTPVKPNGPVPGRCRRNERKAKSATKRLRESGEPR